MITSRLLANLGLPEQDPLLRIIHTSLAHAQTSGADEAAVERQCGAVAAHPQSFLEDPVFGPLARALLPEYPGDLSPAAPEYQAPWRQWGKKDIDVDEATIAQMTNACRLPIAIQGALMPDAHVGYGLPIGGVLAVAGCVIPYAVGVDIACRMRLTVLDLPVSSLLSRREALIRTLETHTRFGVGAAFDKDQLRNHAVMEDNWNLCPVTAQLKEKAWKQLGTSGAGNHFVEFGELTLKTPELELQPGTYLALLSHSGSRGSGEAIARYYSQLAMDLCPQLPHELRHLAWLDLARSEGLEYWHAMQLMGRYAAANHELIHHHVLEAIGATALASVENHHNFAWEENLDGLDVIVHRKGATPAGKGAVGIVPGSMGTPGFIVRGKGNKEALNSCSHGAGRLMSRNAALSRLDHESLRRFLDKKGVHLISGGLDEAPMAYKDIHTIMKAQTDLVDILAQFEPRLVKMAPGKHNKRNMRRTNGKKYKKNRSS